MNRLRGRSPHRLEAAPPGRRLGPLWRNRDFILLWSGQVVSTIGTRITSIAFPLLVLAETHSPAQAGLVGFAQSLPYMLFYLPAGALVDRWDRKRVMLVADAGRAIALGSLALALALGTFELTHVIAVAFVEGALFVFFSLSESAALPQVVPKKQLSTAVAQNQARIQGADLAGQPLGGLLFGISRLLPFAADAISYAISFVSLLFIRSQFQEERVRSTTRLRAEIVEGVTWLWRQQFMRAAVLLIAVSNYAFAAVILSLIVREQKLGASSGAIGIMLAFFGAGALAGSVFAPSVQRRVHPKVVIIACFWIWAAAALASAFIENPYAIGAVWAIGSSFGPIFNVTFAAYRYALVPDRLLARVGSAALVVAWGAIPLGQLSAGVLLEHLGGRETILLLAALMAAVGIAATLSRTIRTAQRAEELAALDAVA
jgi:MFS family permease